MVSEEEFGSLVAEFEGFRDTILDLLIDLRKDVEKMRDEVNDIRDKQAASVDFSQRRLG